MKDAEKQPASTERILTPHQAPLQSRFNLNSYKPPVISRFKLTPHPKHVMTERETLHPKHVMTEPELAPYPELIISERVLH